LEKPMGLKERINQAKCATGMHAGEWQWVAERNCGQVRTCTRCGNVAQRESHNLTEWLPAGDPANPCLMERHCQRCRNGETQVEHALEFKYQAEIRVDNAKSAVGAAFAAFVGGTENCWGQSVCTRCGYTDGHKTQQHTWTKLYYPNDDHGRRLQRHCVRCNWVDKA
jgi:hypothetical protein